MTRSIITISTTWFFLYFNHYYGLSAATSSAPLWTAFIHQICVQTTAITGIIISPACSVPDRSSRHQIRPTNKLQKRPYLQRANRPPPLSTRNWLSHHPHRQQRAFTISVTQATLRLPADAGLAYLVPLVWCRFPTRPGQWLSCRQGHDLIPLPGTASPLLCLARDLRVRLQEAGLPSRRSCEIVLQRDGMRGVGGGRVFDCVLACTKWWCQERQISAWAEVVSSKRGRGWGCAAEVFEGCFGEVFDGCWYGTWWVSNICLQDGGRSGHDGVRVDV